jgi:hypothetical protein
MDCIALETHLQHLPITANSKSFIAQDMNQEDGLKYLGHRDNGKYPKLEECSTRLLNTMVGCEVLKRYRNNLYLRCEFEENIGTPSKKEPSSSLPKPYNIRYGTLSVTAVHSSTPSYPIEGQTIRQESSSSRLKNW